MALADSVPGVSGGTIAFVLGFYDKFIGSLNTLTSKKTSKDEKKEAFKFLIKLGCGWVLGFLMAVIFITSLFEEHIYEVSSLFVGFIILSIPIIVKEEKNEIKNKYKNIIFSVIGMFVVVLVAYLNSQASEEGINLSGGMNFGLMFYVFIAGMIAISAMVLPGISGSTLLLIFGLYAPIMKGIKEILKLNFESLPYVCALGVGIIIGILTTIKVINYCLKNHRSQTIYFILGLMIGSIYAVFMGPTTVGNEPMDFGSFNIIFFILGAALIFGLEKTKMILEKKK